jgi:hypothetical protein
MVLELSWWRKTLKQFHKLLRDSKGKMHGDF